MGPNGYDILNIDSSIQAYVFDLIWPHRQIIRESLYPYSETNYHPFRGITAAPALFLVLSPLALFLFHQTLSRVKAGWDHITRIGSYTLALAPIATTFVVWFSSFMYGFFFSLFFDPSDFQGTAGPPSSYLLASMQFDLIYNASCLSIVSLFALMWWYRVASCYLQLNHARWVAIAIILVAGGMATLIEMTVWHNQLNEIITRWIDLSLRVRNGDDY